MRIDIPEWLPEYVPFLVGTSVNIFDHKDGECIGYVFNEEGNVHFALQFGDAIITFEHCPLNCSRSRNLTNWYCALGGYRL